MDFQVPNTLATEIANYLSERIISGYIRPGERLQEAHIATELEVSRASVKEALYTLERRHLVDIKPRKGAFASQLNAQHATELYDVYMHLLMMLGKRLCERWQDSHRQHLLEKVSQVARQVNATPPEITEIVKCSFDVMDACCEVVDNEYLTESLDNLKPAVSRAYFLGADRFRHDLSTTGQFFEALTKAVLQRDAPAAERAIFDFAEHQKQLIQRALDPDSAAADKTAAIV
ncbi:MAG: GntR family transcriptional regulator [Marinobacter sp.]|nr:GntR family transcriptional regulator [Marinobacter sp.]